MPLKKGLFTDSSLDFANFFFSSTYILKSKPKGRKYTILFLLFTPFIQRFFAHLALLTVVLIDYLFCETRLIPIALNSLAFTLWPYLSSAHGAYQALLRPYPAPR
jgi:hypothetical protein